MPSLERQIENERRYHREVEQTLQVSLDRVQGLRLAEGDQAKARVLPLILLGAGLREFFKTEELERFLASPQKLLGGDTPLARIGQDKIDDVWALLASLQDGAFV